MGTTKTVRQKTKITLSIPRPVHKKTLHMQGFYNLATVSKIPEEVAQEALLRYERRGCDEIEYSVVIVVLCVVVILCHLVCYFLIL